MKIQAPTYTQVPNDLFDHWLPLLKECELKVLLFIMRKTFGWHKPKAKISLSTLHNKTGCSGSSIALATKSLESYGLLKKEVTGLIGFQETFYELIVNEDSNNSYPCEIKDTPPLNPLPPPPKFAYIKETPLNKPLVDVVKKVKKGITKDDVYHFSIAAKKDWTPEEIELAWVAFEEVSSPISDERAYVEGIITKIRFKNQNKKSKQKQSKGKSWNNPILDKSQTSNNELKNGSTTHSEGVGFSEQALEILLGPKKK